MIRAEKIMKRINELAAISEEAGCLTRTYGTPAFMEAGRLVTAWMSDTGLEVKTDHVGNIRGRWRSDFAGAKTMVIASHIDTVVNAGRFDGPLGIIMGLDLVENLRKETTRLPFHLELIAFCDEEGVRFHTTYLGSKVVAGTFNNQLLGKKDAAGISIKEIIALFGGHEANILADALPKSGWLGYFEIHIEQGPVLYERNTPVALVNSIAGQQRAEILFKGEAGHAGTVPMGMRKDALCAAAEFVLEVEKFAKPNQHKIVATAGKLEIAHPASNVIPGQVTCSLDIRSPDIAHLSAAHTYLKNVCEQTCQNRAITLVWNDIQQALPVACDQKMNEVLSASIQAAGYEVVELVSGAGHDAAAIAEVAPVCMLFVRCFKGISHNPLENVEIQDIAAAIKVADNFISLLIKNHNH